MIEISDQVKLLKAVDGMPVCAGETGVVMDQHGDGLGGVLMEVEFHPANEEHEVWLSVRPENLEKATKTH